MNPSVNPNAKSLYSVDGVYGLFADAAAWNRDSGELYFISLWGRDTAVQALLARLSLPSEQGGFAAFNLTGANHEGKALVRVSNPEHLSKMSGRMPSSGLFGEVAHVWIYAPLALNPDYAGRRALRLLQQDGGDQSEEDLFASDAVWSLFKEVSHLPLLDDWRAPVVQAAMAQGWLKRHSGIALEAVEIDLSAPDYEAAVSRLIQDGQLRLPGETAAPPPPGDGGEEESLPPPGKQRLTAAQLDFHLAHFSGTEVWYRHWLVKGMLYTDGVKFFAEHGGQEGAYWFLDVRHDVS